MKLSVRNWTINLIALGLALQSLLMGCAASTRFQHPANDQALAADALHRYLDRWVGWRSLTARIRISVSNGDSTVSAKGHIMYLMGEKFEVGFVKPYNRVLGNFYVTPEQLVYWENNATPHSYAARDTIHLSKLVPILVPDWDPRDLLPLPVSGRTGGFQPDSMWLEGNTVVISGTSDNASYRLSISRSNGNIESERVSRAGHDPMFKKYGKTRIINGWPVPSRVICADSSGEFAVSWSLSGISLNAQPYRLPSDSATSRSTGSLP